MFKYHGRRRGRRGSGVFNPEDEEHVSHTKVGVWDLYEEKQPKIVAKMPVISPKLQTYYEMYQSLPFVWRMLKDVAAIPGCWFGLSAYTTLDIAASFLPAANLWCSGKMLEIIQTAVEHRTVDKDFLFSIIATGIAVNTVGGLIQYYKVAAQQPLNRRIKRHYSTHYFHALSRLDLPTSEDAAVQRQLEHALMNDPGARSTIAWSTIAMVTSVVSTFTMLCAKLAVLASVLSLQRDGMLLAMITLLIKFLEVIPYSNTLNNAPVWAATTRNTDYRRAEGLKKMVVESSHRQEIVAGNLHEFLTAQYKSIITRLGDDYGDFREMMQYHQQRTRFKPFNLLKDAFKHLPELIYTLRAVQNPMSIPLSLASLQLIKSTSLQFAWSLMHFIDQFGSIAERLGEVRKLYEITNIPNKIEDGTEPFPENPQSVLQGISVEFRNVSFRYPGQENYALKDVSFTIKRGQLCIIVGTNGSGKSTILKLISRLHDPTEGSILVDGRDIKTLKLADLRRAMSALFQDYTHYPLSIKENIGLGEPEYAFDEDRIREAARLGGSADFINKLPDAFDTYVSNPVQDHYSGLPEGTKTLFGKAVDYGKFRGKAGIDHSSQTPLSGGQMQRLAVSRTFMRTLSDEPKVGLLLFDEPSASLDPSAEHDLFERLRNLRGSKTMIFSSHRFGNLTRHADLILYMNDSVIVEEGTHEQLLRKDGEYARIWKLQAQAFLP